MDWRAVDETVFAGSRALLGAVVMVVCLMRASMMDSRARMAAQVIFVSLGMSAAGVVLSFLMEQWLRHAVVVWFLGSVVALLLDGQSEWAGGVPDKILRLSERWPHKERRVGERRQPPPPE